jgi:predicted  nucleic acid-binding Zn-ribbon protein
MASNLSSITQLIPPNPAALDFEEQFRANLELFLSSMQDFEAQFNTTISAFSLGNDDSEDLAAAIGSLTSGSESAYTAIKVALEAGDLTLSQDKEWKKADQTTLESNLRFATLDDRFDRIEGFIKDGYSVTADGDTHTTLQTRFDSVEQRVTDNETLLNNARGSSTSIQDWISTVEALATTVEAEVIAARNGETTLTVRLDAMDAQYDIDAGGSGQKIHNRFTSLENRANNIEANYNIDKGADPTGTPYTRIDDRLNAMEADRSSTQAEVDAAEQRLDAIETQYTDDSTGFSDINARFASAEGRLTANETQYGIDRGGHASIDVRFNDIGTSYAAISGDSTIDFAAKDLNLSGNLQITGDIDMQTTKIVNAGIPSSPTDVTNKTYVDAYNLIQDSRITTLEGSAKLPPTVGYNAKFLMVKTDGSGITWADPPDLDPSLMVSQPYDWVPSVPWQSIQFDGEVYSSKTLSAGFTYFVAGNLRVAPTDSNGDPVVLTLESGSGVLDGLGNPVVGATLIVQGHVLGNLSGIVLDSNSPHKPRLIIQNWSDSKSDYVIPEVTGSINQVRTSDLNLTGTHVFSSKLVLEPNTEFILDTPCKLTFTDIEDDSTSFVNIVDPSVSSIEYFDPVKIIEGAPAAYDTLLEISQVLDTTGSAPILTQLGNVETKSNQNEASIVALDTRMDANEVKISDLRDYTGISSSGGSSLQSQITDLESYVGLTSGSPTSLTTDISQLQTEMDSAEGRLDIAESNINQNASDISSVSNTLTQSYWLGTHIQNKLDALKSDIEGNSSLVDALADLETSFANFDNPLDAVLSELSQKADFTYTYSEMDDGAGNTTITYDLTTPNPDFTSVEAMHDHTVNFDSRLTLVESDLISNYATHLNVSTEIGSLRNEILNNSTLVASLQSLENNLSESDSDLNAVLNLLSQKANQSYNVTETTTEILYDLTFVPDDYTGIQPMYDYAQSIDSSVIDHETRLSNFENRFTFSEELDGSGNVEAYIYTLNPV